MILAGRRCVLIAAITAAVVTATGGPAPGIGRADEPPAPAAGEAEVGDASLERVDRHSDRDWSLFVHSGAMDRTIELRVIRPADTTESRPVLYLLNGAGGGVDDATWRRQTDVVDFFGDKNVNVVTPIGGAFSYYTDWLADDPELGRNKWTTFLTEEVPPIVDAALDASGRNAIAGVSMSATSALALAEHAPQLYDAVASYSGCAETSTDVGSRYVELVVGLGGGDVENMWGPVGDPHWGEQDVIRHAERLRGTAIFVSSSGGLPGSHEVAAWEEHGPAVIPDVALLGVIETAVSGCTDRLRTALDGLRIEATYSTRAEGTHTWGYWEDALHESWPLLSDAIDD
ncbi:alpha/beta hydrolase [Rhodococcus sp. NPDC060086]|uniref:alpha/beta hydrolase n=1 Tax=Rhodococcus sp. NPDC060086 TaxID=3347055 RepID=UPI003656CFAF